MKLTVTLDFSSAPSLVKDLVSVLVKAVFPVVSNLGQTSAKLSQIALPKNLSPCSQTPRLLCYVHWSRYSNTYLVKNMQYFQNYATCSDQSGFNLIVRDSFCFCYFPLFWGIAQGTDCSGLWMKQYFMKNKMQSS